MDKCREVQRAALRWFAPALEQQFDHCDGPYEAKSQSVGKVARRGELRLNNILPENGRFTRTPSRPAQPLPERGHAEGGADLPDTGHIANVDAKLECRGTDRGGRRAAVLQAPLDEISMIPRQACMMGIEFLRQTIFLAQRPQSIRIDLDRLARAREH